MIDIQSWTTETHALLSDIAGVATVTIEDGSLLGMQAGIPCFVVFDEHNNAWRFGPVWGAVRCPFLTAVNCKDKNHNDVKPDPTILMSLVSLYFERVYKESNRYAHSELLRLIGHQVRRYEQRLEIQVNENLPGCPATEYKRRFKAIEGIKEDCRLGLFASLSEKPISQYLLKRYQLPFRLLQGMSCALRFSVKPDLFWPTDGDITEYVKTLKSRDNKPVKAQHSYGPGPREGSNWTGD